MKRPRLGLSERAIDLSATKDERTNVWPEGVYNRFPESLVLVLSQRHEMDESIIPQETVTFFPRQRLVYESQYFGGTPPFRILP